MPLDLEVVPPIYAILSRAVECFSVTCHVLVSPQLPSFVLGTWQKTSMSGQKRPLRVVKFMTYIHVQNVHKIHLSSCVVGVESTMLSCNRKTE